MVQKEKDAPSGGQVLAQVDADYTDYRFPVAVANQPLLRDLQLSVRCKPVSGKVDQACGVVFRYRDENNYYVARANALEDNVTIYHTIKGKRVSFKNIDTKVAAGVWHTLRVEFEGNKFAVIFDGKKVIEATDDSFSDGGKVGVWTKADSVTLFDDFTYGSK